MRSRIKKVRLSNGQQYSYLLPWDGRIKLRGTHKCPVSFDTETEKIRAVPGYEHLAEEKRPLDPTHIPTLSVATVSDGKRSFFLHPDQLANFLRLHHREHFVGQNFAFDFWVIDKFLRDSGAAPAVIQSWWSIANQGRLHDTILLDMLIRLAQAAGFEAHAKEDTSLSRRNLGELAADYLGLHVDKQDPFRLRYGELIGRDWSTVQEEGFWSYAIKDAIVTQLVWRKQVDFAERLLAEARRQHPKEFLPQCVREWGYLTETLQTRASLALDFMSKKGLRVDTAKAAEQEARHRQSIQGEIARMWELAPQVFKYRRERVPGQRRLRQLPAVLENVALTEKGQTPQLDTKALILYLEGVASQAGFAPPQSCGKRGILTSKSAKAWFKYKAASPFLEAWANVALLAKRLGFFQILRDQGMLYPKYRPLMRTGRISAYKPNVTQFPREADFRSMFIARPDHKILTIDYAFIELRTLAAVCEHRYGSSRLADTIRAGIDPHAYTAAMILNMPVQEFLALKNTNEAFFKDARQKAKPLNFGAPGGLGAAKLSSYASASYGVEMSVEEAAILRHKLIHEVYPELARYLSDTTLQAMAYNFQVSKKQILRAFNVDAEDGPEPLFRAMRAVGKILRGKPQKADGTPYKPRFVERMWDGLERLASDSGRLPATIKEQIRARQPSEKLERILLCGPALTITGRIRGSATYTQLRNSPFQGLAADGGKLALWNCLVAGYQPLAFIHDELLVEVPAATAEQAAAQIDQILVRSMMEVMDNKMPVECSRQLGDYWQK